MVHLYTTVFLVILICFCNVISINTYLMFRIFALEVSDLLRVDNSLNGENVAACL